MSKLPSHRHGILGAEFSRIHFLIGRDVVDLLQVLNDVC